MPKRRGIPRYFTRKRRPSGNVTYWWQPSGSLRDAGFLSERLSDNIATAYRRCDELNDILDRWRRGEAVIQASSAPKEGTFTWLCDQYRGSHEFQGARATTRADYEKQMAHLKKTFGPSRVGGITTPVVYAFKQGLRGGRQSQYRLQVLRLVLEHGRRMGIIAGENPAAGIGGFRLKARKALWTDEQIAAFKARAAPSLCLAIDLALYTGQREGDILKMRWSDIRDGWIEIVQSKTSKEISIPIHTKLKAALAATPKRGLHLVISEETGLNWKFRAFCDNVRDARIAAGLESVLFMDLRRTAVTRLGEAGCTVPQIASITGHSVKDVQAIIDTYLRPTRKMAAAAIRRLEKRR